VPAISVFLVRLSVLKNVGEDVIDINIFNSVSLIDVIAKFNVMSSFLIRNKASSRVDHRFLHEVEKRTSFRILGSQVAIDYTSHFTVVLANVTCFSHVNLS